MSVLARALVSAHQTVEQEVDQPLEIVEGRVPDGLRGVLFRNGPGRMDRGGVAYGHLFDGDGMVLRFAFTDAGIHYRNRFVRTRGWLEEERAGRILYRNFGTNRPGGMLQNAFRLRFKNAANTSVVYHAGRLLALWEGGAPHELDPVTLETRGVWDFDGRLAETDPVMRRLAGSDRGFSAHPRVDPETGEMHNFGLVMGPRTTLQLYRIDPAGRMDLPERVPLSYLGFIHDFMLTPRWRIFLLAPLAFDQLRMLLGVASPIETARFAGDRPTRMLLVPREGGKPRYLDLDPCFVFHFANGFEEGEDRIVLDGHRMDRYPEIPRFEQLARRGLDDLPRSYLTRFEIDLSRRTVRERRLTDHSGDLPVINRTRTGRPYRYTWSSSAPAGAPEPYATGILKVDVDQRVSTFRGYGTDLTSEPVFVPRAGATAEDDGWLLHTLYRSAEHRTDLLVLDAGDLSVKCRARLPHHVSPGFHGTWVEASSMPAA